MIVPRFWAEARLSEKRNGKSYSLRRYGWSDVSLEEAQRLADERVRDAMARIVAGEPLGRREKKASYGVEGVPIREEVVSRHGESVVTRNIYGARCLNTPNVLFVDVDFKDEIAPAVGCAVVLLTTVGPVVAAFLMLPLRRFLAAALPTAFLGFLLGLLIIYLLSKAWTALRGGIEQIAKRRIERFFASRELSRWRLYRTPQGYRVMVIHRPFEPSDPEVEETFQGLKTDKLYALLCRKQQCFRARVSPKPWRIGCERMPPNRAVWPIPPERMAERVDWVEHYEKAAADYAACRFEGEFGEGLPDSNVVTIQRLHDQLCRAESGLPIA